MFDLQGSDSPNEFVEVYNSGTDSIDLSLWQINDRFSTDELVDGGMGTIIAPERYALIMEGDYDETTGIYLNLIPDSVLIVRVDDSSIGNGLSASDSLFITDSSDTISDSLGWSDISAPGFSYERKRLDKLSTPSNWATSLDSLGTPGFVNSVTPPPIDAALIPSSISHSPDNPSPSDTVTLTVTIVNEGTESISGIVDVSEEADLAGSSNFSDLTDGDSTNVDISLGALSSGQHLFIISVLVDGEEDTTDNSADYALTVRYTERVLTPNEFLYAPAAGTVEFIEFAVLSEDSLHLSGWGFSDSDTSNIRFFPAVTVQSGDLIVVSSDSSLLPLLPPEGILLVSEDGFPGLNNSGDEIYLFDPTGTTIDSLIYTSDWGGESGHSLEKLLPYLDSPELNNWATSLDSVGTPGNVNSVTPAAMDITLDSASIYHTPTLPTPDQEITLTATLFNIGTDPISGTLTAYENDIVLSSTNFPTVASNDSSKVDIHLEPLSSGQHTLAIVAEVPDDANSDNNEAEYSLAVRFMEKVLSINEIHYSPDAGVAEFIELAVLNSDQIDLTGWHFSDSDTFNLRFFPTETFTDGDLIVVSSDSSLLPYLPLDGTLLVSPDGFFTLNNSGDDIFLFDPTGTVNDFVSFTDDWGGGDGRSLEKLNPQLDSPDANNWGSCTSVEKMTPGADNSILVENLPEAGSVLFDPNPFSPDGDRFEDELRISYSLPFAQAYLTVQIFDSIGRDVRTLARNLVTGAEGILIWDGRFDSGERARIGIYIIKVEAVDQSTGKSVEWLKTAVLAEQLR